MWSSSHFLPSFAIASDTSKAMSSRILERCWFGFAKRLGKVLDMCLYPICCSGTCFLSHPGACPAIATCLKSIESFLDVRCLFPYGVFKFWSARFCFTLCWGHCSTLVLRFHVTQWGLLTGPVYRWCLSIERSSIVSLLARACTWSVRGRRLASQRALSTTLPYPAASSERDDMNRQGGSSKICGCCLSSCFFHPVLFIMPFSISIVISTGSVILTLVLSNLVITLSYQATGLVRYEYYDHDSSIFIG